MLSEALIIDFLWALLPCTFWFFVVDNARDSKASQLLAEQWKIKLKWALNWLWLVSSFFISLLRLHVWTMATKKWSFFLFRRILRLWWNEKCWRNICWLVIGNLQTIPVLPNLLPLSNILKLSIFFVILIYQMHKFPFNFFFSFSSFSLNTISFLLIFILSSVLWFSFDSPWRYYRRAKDEFVNDIMRIWCVLWNLNLR